MRPSHLISRLALVACVALSLAACDSVETPSEPPRIDGLPLHMIAQNQAELPLGVQAFSSISILITGASVEFDHVYADTELGKRLNVYRFFTPPRAGVYRWAHVQYNIKRAARARLTESNLTVRFSTDPDGRLVLTPDRPDVFEVTAVSYDPEPSQ